MTSEDDVHRLRCACGWEATGTRDELLIAAEDHGRHLHNMVPTREQVVAMLLPVPNE